MLKVQIHLCLQKEEETMTIKPVDVFMSNEPCNDCCPIEVLAIFGGMLLGVFQEMDEKELEKWPEINYTGYIGEIGDVLVVLDAGPDGVTATIDDDDGGKWQIELTGEAIGAPRSA